MVSTTGIIEREQLLDVLAGPDVRGFIADHFPKWADPAFLARFLMRYELMKLVVEVSGSVVEGGIKHGDGMMSWYWISKLIEPLNRRRLIYGFDTFCGLSSVCDKDRPDVNNGDQAQNKDNDPERAFEMLTRDIDQSHLKMVCCDLYRSTNLVAFRHGWNQMHPIKGDFMETGEKFLADNPHIVVALLYLDFDVYAPTKKAIELFLPRMPKGAVIAFDELDHVDWPGETTALVDTIGIRELRIKRFPWMPTMAYAVLE